jgi:hypothetical protein
VLRLAGRCCDCDGVVYSSGAWSLPGMPSNDLKR